MVTLAVAFPVSWLMAMTPPFAPGLLFAIVVLSMWTNLLTRTYARIALLQNIGMVNRAVTGLGLAD